MTIDGDFTGTNPNLTIQHTGSDAFGWHTEAGSLMYLNNETDGRLYFLVDAAHSTYLPQLVNCDTIDTDGQGRLRCGTDGGGGGNSFETISVPAGTNPVADSATDTLTITETSPLVITGTAGTDTIAITWDGVISDNDFIGLSSSTGRIEFDDQATDEVNILNANVGIGTATPSVLLHLVASDGALPALSAPALLIESTAATGDDARIDLIAGGGTGSFSIIDFGDTASATAGQFLYSHENDYFSFSVTGRGTPLYIGTSTGSSIGRGGDGTPDAEWDVQPVATTTVGVTIDLLASHSANALRVVNSDAAVIFQVEPDGDVAILNSTGPDYTLQPTSGDIFGWHAENGPGGGVSWFGNSTDATHYLRFTGGGAVQLPGLLSCDTLDTSADGTLRCGSDATGAGAGSPAGTGSELQYRVDGSTFGAVTSSSVSGANVTLAGDLALSGFAGPDITLAPTSGDTWHVGAENGPSGGVFLMSNSTDSRHFLRFTGGGTIELPQNTSCDILKTNSLGVLSCGPANADIGSLQLPVTAAKLPATNPCVIDNSENHAKLLCDASTAENAFWQFVMPQDYGVNPVVYVAYAMASATSGGVTINVTVMATTPGDSVDVNTQSFAGANLCSDATVPATAGFLDSITCALPLARVDSLAAGDLVKIDLQRAVADAGDTATGDLEVYGVRFSWDQT